MDLDVLQSGKTCTIRVKGRMIMGDELDAFDAAVAAALASDHPFLILNLEAMPMIDSSGIGAIVSSLQQSKKLGGDTLLVNLSPFALKTFKMVHILNLFSVFGSEAEAIHAAATQDFHKGPAPARQGV